MTKITIGKSEGKDIAFDLEAMLPTRLLIQANSGGGKSYAIRKIAEQAAGKVQIVIIDWAGEFSTLREKYDYVLVGEGGETQIDVRSANLLATRLLELKVSAICDLYSLKPADRHVWVKNFLEAMMNAPKKLWHPVLIVIDEAHKFCPEKGEGESVAKQSVLSLCSDGRKYGFCAVLATQRLAKLDKSAASELLNVMVGPTFIDVDLERAHKALGIVRADWAAFDEQMKTTEPGHFWVLGRAITKKRLLVKIDKVETSHPESGKGQIAPPPMPANIAKLLPSLEDLPKEAETKAKTEADLRKEVADLKRQLASRPAQEVEKVRVEEVKVPVFSNGEVEQLASLVNQIGIALKDAQTLAKTPKPHPAPRSQAISAPRVTSAKPITETVSSDPSAITNPMQRILDAIAWQEDLGIDAPRQVAVAFLAGYTYGGGAFNNPRGALRTMGLVDYINPDRIKLTEKGKEFANWPQETLTIDDLQEKVLSILPGPEQKILRVLIDAYPNEMTKAECAQASGYAQGGAFNNPLGRLRSLGLIDYPQPGYVVALPVLFLG